jgi:uncharacterized membrane protein
VIPHLTLFGSIHAALAGFGIVAGAIQFMLSKGGPIHRATGYAYVYAMLVADATAMLVYRFNGHFNPFHVGAIVNFICIVLAIVPLLLSPRPARWRTMHYHFIAWSYVSLISAAATEITARSGWVTTRDRIGLAALVLSLVTMAIAHVVIRKNRPPANVGPAPDRLIEQGGAPS